MQPEIFSGSFQDVYFITFGELFRTHERYNRPGRRTTTAAKSTRPAQKARPCRLIELAFCPLVDKICNPDDLQLSGEYGVFTH